jgi:hypothetical protein
MIVFDTWGFETKVGRFLAFVSIHLCGIYHEKFLEERCVLGNSKCSGCSINGVER